MSRARSGRRLIAGLVAFGMLLPLIGFSTVQNIRNELMLEPRWPLLAALVAIVVASSASCMSLVVAPWRERARAARPEGASIAAARTARGIRARWIVPFALGFAFLYPVIRDPARRHVRAR